MLLLSHMQMSGHIEHIPNENKFALSSCSFFPPFLLALSSCSFFLLYLLALSSSSSVLRTCRVRGNSWQKKQAKKSKKVGRALFRETAKKQRNGNFFCKMRGVVLNTCNFIGLYFLDSRTIIRVIALK